jgi:hypothetical protein
MDRALAEQRTHLGNTLPIQFIWNGKRATPRQDQRRATSGVAGENLIVSRSDKLDV